MNDSNLHKKGIKNFVKMEILTAHFCVMGCEAICNDVISRIGGTIAILLIILLTFIKSQDIIAIRRF